MAIHDQLPIYRTGVQLLALAVQRGLQEAPAGQVEDVHQVLVLSWNHDHRRAHP